MLFISVKKEKTLSLFQTQIESFRPALPTVSDGELAKLEIFYRILQDWNQKISLVSRASFDRVIANHFADSLWSSEICRPFVRFALADIGTGAGFPGVVFAIRYPEISVTLYEKMLKRRNYLAELLKELSLPKVKLAGQMTKREGADFYFARAVLPPGELLTWASTFLRPTDRIALHLGSVRKEFIVPKEFRSIHRKIYLLPSTEGSREIEIYERVPRGT